MVFLIAYFLLVVVEMNFLGGVELDIIGLDEHFMADGSPAIVVAPKVPSLVLVLLSIILILAHSDFVLNFCILGLREVVLWGGWNNP